MKTATFLVAALLASLPLAASRATPQTPLAQSPANLLSAGIVAQLPCESHPRHGRLLISFTTPYGRFYIDRDRYLSLIELPRRAAFPGRPSQEPLSIGSETRGLPKGFQTLLHQGETHFYSQGNFFAYHGDTGFIVIDPPVGAYLNTLPAEAQPQGKAIEIPGATLMPVNRFGRLAYQVQPKR